MIFTAGSSTRLHPLTSVTIRLIGDYKDSANVKDYRLETGTKLFLSEKGQRGMRLKDISDF